MLGTRRRSARVRALARPNTAINGKRSRTDRLFSRSARSQIARLTPALPEQLLRRSRGAQKLLRAPKEADCRPKYGPKAAPWHAPGWCHPWCRAERWQLRGWNRIASGRFEINSSRFTDLGLGQTWLQEKGCRRLPCSCKALQIKHHTAAHPIILTPPRHPPSSCAAGQVPKSSKVPSRLIHARAAGHGQAEPSPTTGTTPRV